MTSKIMQPLRGMVQAADDAAKFDVLIEMLMVTDAAALIKVYPELKVCGEYLAGTMTKARLLTIRNMVRRIWLDHQLT